MNLRIKLLLVFTGFAILVVPGLAAPGGEAGFVSMFDGKSFKGWTVKPESAAEAWTIREGMIVGNGDLGRCYLEYDSSDVADFELKLSYRFPGKGNSGVNIRSIPDTTGKRLFTSYHADIGHVGVGKEVLGAWDFHTPGRREHECFRGDRLVIDKDDNPTRMPIEGAVTLDDIKQGGWNDIRVIASGNKFTFYVNGKLSSEFTEYLPDERRLHSGKIQLQLHNPGMIVHFKNLRIRIDDQK